MKHLIGTHYSSPAQVKLAVQKGLKGKVVQISSSWANFVKTKDIPTKGVEKVLAFKEIGKHADVEALILDGPYKADAEKMVVSAREGASALREVAEALRKKGRDVQAFYIVRPKGEPEDVAEAVRAVRYDNSKFPVIPLIKVSPTDEGWKHPLDTTFALATKLEAGIIASPGDIMTAIIRDYYSRRSVVRLLKKKEGDLVEAVKNWVALMVEKNISALAKYKRYAKAPILPAHFDSFKVVKTGGLISKKRLPPFSDEAVLSASDSLALLAFTTIVTAEVKKNLRNAKGAYVYLGCAREKPAQRALHTKAMIEILNEAFRKASKARR